MLCFLRGLVHYLPTYFLLYPPPLCHHCHYHDALLILTDWTYPLIILTSLLRILVLHTPHHASTIWAWPLISTSTSYIYICLLALHAPVSPSRRFPFIRVAYFTAFIDIQSSPLHIHSACRPNSLHTGLVSPPHAFLEPSFGFIGVRMCVLDSVYVLLQFFAPVYPKFICVRIQDLSTFLTSVLHTRIWLFHILLNVH